MENLASLFLTLILLCCLTFTRLGLGSKQNKPWGVEVSTLQVLIHHKVMNPYHILIHCSLSSSPFFQDLMTFPVKGKIGIPIFVWQWQVFGFGYFCFTLSVKGFHVWSLQSIISCLFQKGLTGIQGKILNNVVNGKDLRLTSLLCCHGDHGSGPWGGGKGITEWGCSFTTGLTEMIVATISFFN